MKNLVVKDRPSEECISAFYSQCQAFFLNTETGHAYLATNIVIIAMLASSQILEGEGAKNDSLHLKLTCKLFFMCVCLSVPEKV